MTAESPDLAAQRAAPRGGSPLGADALPRGTPEWAEANRAFYELAQVEIAQRRAKTQPELSDRYVAIHERIEP